MNVLVVEDSEAEPGYLQSVLSDIPGITVIGHAADKDNVIGRIDTQLPDAVIFDISLRNGAVAYVLEDIKKHHPGIKVMILADCTNEYHFNSCLYTGEDNFFDKASQFMRIRAILWQWVFACRLDSRFEALQAF